MLPCQMFGVVKFVALEGARRGDWVWRVGVGVAG